MKKTVFFFILLLGIALDFFVAASSVNAAFTFNSTCPVMPGRRVYEKYAVDYQGRHILLCCRSCAKAFKKRPERYLANLS